MTASTAGPAQPPEFIVDTPVNRPTERAYALGVLFGEWLGVGHTVHVDPALMETRIRLAGRDRGPVIVLPETVILAEMLSPTLVMTPGANSPTLFWSRIPNTE